MATARELATSPPIKIFDPLPPVCSRHRKPITGAGDLRTCTSDTHGKCMFVLHPKGTGWIRAKDRMKMKGRF